MIGEARRRKLIRRKERWHFVIEDFDAPNFVVSDDINAGAHDISHTILITLRVTLAWKSIRP